MGGGGVGETRDSKAGGEGGEQEVGVEGDGLPRSLSNALFGTAAPDDEGQAAAMEEEQDIRQAFRVFDKDGDGFISTVELQVVLAKLGPLEARNFARVHETICSIDQDRDGWVDFNKFKHMMQGISVRSIKHLLACASTLLPFLKAARVPSNHIMGHGFLGRP